MIITLALCLEIVSRSRRFPPGFLILGSLFTTLSECIRLVFESVVHISLIK